MIIDLLLWVAWNIYLAVIPVIAAYGLVWLWGAPARRPALRMLGIVFVGAIWFFFLPNTCYLFTEWRHFLAWLDGNTPSTRWQELREAEAFLRLLLQVAFYTAYSGIGLITFTLATRPVARAAGQRGWPLWLLAIPFFFLMALGVYLGLILRFNSWELLTKPLDIWREAMLAVQRPRLLGIIIGFAAMLWVSYTMVDIWIDGLLGRVRHWRRRRAEAGQPV